MKALLFGLCVSLALPASAFAAAKTAPAAKKDPRAQMHVLAAEISVLQRYLLSEAAFADPKNEKAIRSSVESMRRHVGALDDKKGPFAEDPALRANAGQLARHLEGVSRTFRSGDKNFARYMLQSSLSMCVACHTAGKVKYDFHLPEGDGLNAPPLERANYLFATRQFDKGKDLYEKLVDGYPENKAERTDVQKALNALAVYYVRVKEDPKAGASYFSAIAKESWASENDRQEFKAWADYLKAWSEEPAAKLEGDEGLLGEARRVLNGDDLTAIGKGTGAEYVRRLRASALLHRVLESPGTKSTTKGEALLLLGQVYQRLNHHLFFRFGEMYLKACVREYKGEKVAQDCYRALERSIQEGYTGSSGTKIPADERAELDALKKLAF
jgi:tetratricopeptide (TPR) repeat protein